MKRIIYIIILLLPLVNGCTKTGTPPASEKFGRYIFFSQDVETKASLVESAAAMDQFGVVGFKYDNSLEWNDVKGSATPNVFYDGTGKLVDTETLTCNTDRTATYEPLQGWRSNEKYSFFAYYPIGHDNVTFVKSDDGTPAIQYTMDVASPASSMVDVMTAPAHIDKYWKSSSDNNTSNRDIRFQFAHRLSCLGLNLKNSSPAEIQIKSIAIIVNDIKYSNAIIPFDETKSEKYAGPAITGSIFSLTIRENEKYISSTGTEVSDKLIFIPQIEDVSISLSIVYQRKRSGAETYEEDEIFTTQSPVKTNLIKGIKHLIHLNFMDSNIYVMVGSGNWEDGPNVNHEFN